MSPKTHDVSSLQWTNHTWNHTREGTFSPDEHRVYIEKKIDSPIPYNAVQKLITVLQRMK